VPGNREISWVPAASSAAGGIEVYGRTPMTRDGEKSDRLMYRGSRRTMPRNRQRRGSREASRQRGTRPTDTTTGPSADAMVGWHRASTSGSQTGQETALTALPHHVYDIDRLRGGVLRSEARRRCRRRRRDVADNGEALEGNLQDLAARVTRGAFRASPVRRAYIPKADGRQRPLGVPTLEDKIGQRAVVEVLNAIPRSEPAVWDGRHW
jgi:hypothetical protein